jgi:hypothetical protein
MARTVPRSGSVGTCCGQPLQIPGYAPGREATNSSSGTRRLGGYARARDLPAVTGRAGILVELTDIDAATGMLVKAENP